MKRLNSCLVIQGLNKGSVSLISMLLFTGCAATVTEGPSYYLLSAVATDGQPFDIDVDRIGLGPVSLPSHFDREGILTYNDKNQLEYSESHRWAEPLQENTLQVLRTNIVRLLPNQQIVFFPWRQQDKPQFQIVINVSRFGLQSEQKVVLLATWEITDDSGAQILIENANLSETIADSDYGTVVNAQSLLLSKLSFEITRKIAELATQNES